ncbi:uncharacterized protein BDZ99DRAFT_458796 [Mytilinidion resinicola]|uniref:Uncharacterized protein n=1 Tax=Mytilinidion resinicola TaxID=574789 RepID=A0A6A6Z3G5_9PEZI|nr:uncharacterized protein BDZ99DRAFT_458796 [Mytilinidion resinicola]KAF2814824.1 hypothetical protein BDZ99DRAFT_458796 [Mytilinidion resinicola]
MSDFDLDPLAELNRLADAALSTDAQAASTYPSPDTIARWQRLFHYDRKQALQLITAQRLDLSRTRISDTHWELVRPSREAAGHDRESYEHALGLGKVLKEQSATITITTADGRQEQAFVFRLGGLLENAEKVREVAGLEKLPKVVNGQGEMGPAQFCVVDLKAKGKVEDWLAMSQVAQSEKGS